MKRCIYLNLLAVCIISFSLIAQTDTVLIKKIKSEAIENSKVMDLVLHLSTLNGPRLTNSKGMKSANEWTKATLESYGLKAWIEPWGEFGKGWDVKNFHATVTAPYAFPLIAYPKAWSPSTKGLVKGKIIYVGGKTLDEVKTAYSGKIKGAVVMLGTLQSVETSFEPLADRLSEKELLDKANTLTGEGRYSNYRERFRKTPGYKAYLEKAKVFGWVNSQQPALILDGGSIRAKSQSGTVFVQQAMTPLTDTTDAFSDKNTGAYKMNAPVIAPQLIIASEEFNQIIRLIQSGQDVSIECNLDVEYQTKDLQAYNTVAEWEGTDLKSQVVMLGGHLDSWHSGTGATDNAAGCAVMMEAMRILRKLDFKPRRTIRIALWSGEEQGLLGSRGYVKNHFGTKDSTKEEYGKLSVYYNLDNGTGQIRGMHMQGNDKVRRFFSPWLDPFKDWNANTLTLESTGSTDHMAFDEVGLPGFQFIQDPIDYDTRTHHSNMDVYERILDQDMKRNAAIVAYFIYQTAMMDEMIPRK